MSPSGHDTMVPNYRPAPDYETAPAKSDQAMVTIKPRPAPDYETAPAKSDQAMVTIKPDTDEQTMYGNMYGEDVTLNWADEVDREFPLEYTFENISSDELEVTSQGGLEDISSDELEEINITLENVSEGDFDI